MKCFYCILISTFLDAVLCHAAQADFEFPLALAQSGSSQMLKLQSPAVVLGHSENTFQK